MNRDHYLSKRSRSPLQVPMDKQAGQKDKADADQLTQPIEPAESRPTNAVDTAKQKAESGQ